MLSFEKHNLKGEENGEAAPLIAKNRLSSGKQILWYLWCNCRVILVALVVGIAVLSWCWVRRPALPNQGKAAAWDQLVGKSLLTNKPQSDHRQYQYAEFTNGLKVVNVRDEKAKSSSFAVAVEAGSLLDPANVQGLAHFCEHMLFLGTKKYPESSGFDQYLNLYGGSNNAYTSEDATVYYAQLEHSGWQEGLDRVSDFFRAPLFRRQFVEKEVHAIESEHAKNKQSPVHRTFQIMSSLADPRSPVSRFHTGDLGTLIDEPKKKNIDTVAELKKYFEQNYCPPRMRLVTFGKDGLDDQLAESLRHFADIPKGQNCSVTPPDLSKPDPWHPKDGPSRMGNWIDTKSTQPQAQLHVMWALPYSLEEKYKEHPVSYLQYVMNYGGERSFFRTMKDDLGLVTSLHLFADSNSINTAIWFSADLTHLGQKNTNLVLACLHAFLAQMKDNDIDMKLFDSIAKVQKLMWDWSEDSAPSTATQDLVEEMIRLPKEDLLDGDYTTRSPDKKLTRQVLDALTPDNMNIEFVDPDWDPKAHEGGTYPVQTEKHYDAKYMVRPLSNVIPEGILQWHQWLADPIDLTRIFKELNVLVAQAKLPSLVPMRHAPVIADVPDKITLEYADSAKGTDLETSTFGVRPRVVTPVAHSGTFWFRQGSMSKDPKVDMRFLLRAARDDGDGPSPRDELLLSVYGSLLAEQLNPKTFDLSRTGVSYSIQPYSTSLSFKFAGFKQNMPKLMNIVFNEFKQKLDSTSKVVQKRYARIVEKLRDDLKTYSKMPVVYALQDRNLILQKTSRSNEEYVKALDSLQLKDVPDALHSQMLSKKLHYTSLIMGNIPEEEATANDEKFMLEIAGVDSSLSIDNVELVTPVVQPQMPIEVRKLNPRPNDPNDVTIVTVLKGIPDIADRVLYSIISDILQQTAYDELRTKRQLGYVVNAGMIQLSNVIGLSAVVQGKELAADKVEPLIEWLYHTKMPQILGTMSDEKFETYKDSFAQRLAEPPLGFSSEVQHYWPSISEGGQCFGLRVQMSEWLHSKLLSPQQLLDAWKAAMKPGPSGLRKKIVVKYFANRVPERPSVEESAKEMRGAGVPENVVKLTQQEYGKTLVFDKADSSTRQAILEDAKHRLGTSTGGSGYYPEDLGCPKLESSKHNMRNPQSRHR